MPLALDPLRVIPAVYVRKTADQFDLAAGKSIEIRTKTPTVTLLDATVPAGKVWHVQIDITVTESVPA